MHHNTFRFTPSHIGPACTAAAGCGYVGLVSNYGTYPNWSPYKGEAVEDDIAFAQDNRWYANRYVGPWRFQLRELGDAVSWRTWRDRQDRLSTLQSE